jgi:hypothetical protein
MSSGRCAEASATAKACHRGAADGEERGNFANLAPIRYVFAVNKQSPIVSEFETPEQEVSYLEWLKRKVAESLADPRPPVPHDQVMAEMRDIVAKAKQKKSC